MESFVARLRAASCLLVGILIFSVPLGAQVVGRSVNMVAGREWPGGDPFLQRQNEPSCAVSSGSPFRMLCAANDYRTVDLPGLPEGGVIGDAWLGVFLSFDGGNRWQSTLLPGFPQDTSPEAVGSPLWGFEAGADPVVRSAHNRLFYLSGIVFDRGEHEPAATFVARFIDLNNKEGAAFDIVGNTAPIRYLDADVTFFARAGRFADKPWLAADVPREGAQMCHIEVPQEGGEPIVQEFPGGNVYQTFAVFQGDEEGTLAKMMFTRSTDCGDTWSRPMMLSSGHHISQGSVIAIDPLSGDVYVAWRRFAFDEQTDAVLVAKSVNGGRTFGRPVAVAQIDPFEQGSSSISFRTTMFPTMAVDNDGRVHVAWSETMGPEGDGRIVVSTSTDGGFTWSVPLAVDSPVERRGHQFMPSLLSHQGELRVLYYEQALDHTFGTLVCPGTCTDISEFVEVREPAGDLADGLWWKVFNQCLVEVAPDDSACDLSLGWENLARRHTLDVFVARAEPAADPIFDTPVQVSRYAYGSRPGADLIEQLQFNPPIFPLFALGTQAFIGDYIDLAGAPPVVPTGSGGWTFNSETADGWLGYGVWTSNQDVRPPPDGDWTTYTPPGFTTSGPSLYDPSAERPACVEDRAGMRNQNIYMARITDGLVTGAVQNSKPLGMVPNPDPDPGEPDMIPIQRTFVIVVQNATPEIRHFRMTLLDPALGVEASFLQFDPLSELEVSVAPYSTISRSVFVISPDDPAASVTVLVQEIADVGGGLPPIPDGLAGSVVLNPDPTAPDIVNPDITNPDITNPDIINAEVYNPDITNPDITNPDITNPDITNPDITNPDITNPDIINPDITNPDITNPDITNPDITNPDITNPDITNPDIINGTISDATWTVTNNGNTSMAFDVNLLLAGRVPEGFKLQMILHKVYTTPVALGCELLEETHNTLVVSIPEPEFVTDPADLAAIDPTNPDITNAAIPLAPGETGKITLRIVDPDRFDNVTAETFLEDNVVAPVVVSQSVDTESAADAVFGGEPPPPPPVSVPLTILTASLPGAIPGTPYGQTLQAIGGEPPYLWSIVAGALPPGLGLDPSTGLISGTPSASGSYTFTAQVTDSDDPTNSDLQGLMLVVAAPDLTLESLTQTPSTPTTVDLITFTAIVRNIGDSPAAASTLLFTIGSETPGAPGTLIAVPILNAGQSFQVDRQTTLVVAQNYLNTAVADYLDDVTEANEANNTATESFAVALPLPGTLPPEPVQEWGTGGNGEGQFNFGWGIGSGPSGEIYVAEAGGSRVQRFDANGNFELMFGWGVATGAAQFEICTDGCQQAIGGEGAGQFNGPRGVAVDSLGNVVVVDSSNQRIQRFDSDGNFLDAWGWGVATGANAYEICTANCQAGIIGGGQGQFFNPHAVAIDPADDDVLIAGTNMGRVQRFTSDGTYLEMYGGGVNGITLSFAVGVAVDNAGNLFVADLFNHRIVAIGPTGNLLRTWGTMGDGPGEFNEPHGVAVDALGRVYVAERFNHRVQVFDNDGTYLFSWGSQGGAPGQFETPIEIAIGNAGRIYVTDHTARVQVFEFPITVVPPSTDGYWRFEEGSPDAQAFEADSVLDSSTAANHGDPGGGPIYRTDTPGNFIPLTGAANDLSLEFDGIDDEVGFDSLFPFHGTGDATVEFWLNIHGPGHRVFLWTRPDNVDANRFNFAAQDGNFGFDYREPTGDRHILIDWVPGEMIPIGYDTWAHIAVMRTDNQYRVYVDGVLRRTVVDTNPNLPTSVGWQMSGRDGYFFEGSLDELRFADRALSPSETLINANAFRVEALIDGNSELILSRNLAQWHHNTLAAPGLFSGSDEPTVINSADWFPAWPGPGENQSCDCDSDIFASVTPAMPDVEWIVTVREIGARGSINVIQQPTAANDYTTVVEFDDSATAGADWYVFEIDLPPASSNSAPVADAGPDQTVSIGALVQLDGSGSSDPDEDPLTFDWQLTVPSGSAATLDDATAASPTFVADLPGTYVGTLVVNDGTVDSASDTVDIVATLAPTLTLSPDPLALVTNDTGTLTATINTPAGSGGLVVTLLSSDPTVVSVPASVTVAEGTTSAPIPVTTVATTGSATITASATGYTDATSTVNVTARGMALSLVGTTVVGAGRTAMLEVSLDQPALAGGALITVTSDDAGILSVTPPGTLLISEGGTAGQLEVVGVAAGATALRASATGYSEAVLAVTVTNNLISLPATLTVPFGQQTSIPVTIQPDPAPSGGLNITLTSDDPAVEVVTPTVTIPEGAFGASGTARGVTPGTANVTASNPSFASDTSLVTTAAEFNILQATVRFPDGFPTDVTVRLEAAGTPAAAPAGGVPFTLTPDDSTCVAPAAGVIPAGLIETSVTLDYGGSATLPCSTTVTALYTDITADSVPVTVDPRPTISLRGVDYRFDIDGSDIGAGLQDGIFRARLSAAQHGGVTVRIESSNPAVALVSPDSTTEGTTFIDVALADGSTDATFYIQGVEGATGSPVLTASAPGFVDGTGPVDIVQPAYVLSGVPSSIDTLDPDDPFSIYVGLPNATGTTIQRYQSLRIGGGSLTATITNSEATVGELVTTALTGQTVTVDIAEGLYYSPGSVATGGVAFSPLATGTTDVAADIPGFLGTTVTRTVTVTAPTISLRGLDQRFVIDGSDIGAGLQDGVFRARLSAAQHGGVTVRIESSNPSVALVSPDSTTEGTAFIDIPLANDSTDATFYIHGIEGATGSPVLTASAPGFVDGTGPVDIVQPAYVLSGVPSSIDTLDPDDPFSIYVGLPNATGTTIQRYQSLRIGGGSLTATITNSEATVGELVTTAITGQTVTVDIAEGLYYSPGSVATGGVAFSPLATGTTDVAADIPGFLGTTVTRTVTVTAPTISLRGLDQRFVIDGSDIGAGLQDGVFRARLSAAQHGGVTVRIESSNPSVALVSPDSTAEGTTFIDVALANDSTDATFYIQGVEGATGSPVLTASAPGFVDGTGPVDIVQPAYVLSGVPSSIDTLDPDDPFSIYVGLPNATGTTIQRYQSLRIGGGSLTATITNSEATVGELVTTAITGQTVTVDIAEGLYYSPGSVATGGVAFSPLATGTTDVAADIPGFLGTTVTRTVTVTAPTISLRGLDQRFVIDGSDIGAGLQDGVFRARLSAAQHGGVTVRIESSNPSVALVSPDSTTEGTAFIDIPLANDSTDATFYIHGIEGATGSPVLTASAPGFVDGTGPVDIVQPAYVLSGVPSSIDTLDPDDPFSIYVGLPNATGTTIQRYQSLRIGGGSLTATITNSEATVGELVTTALTGQTVTVDIAEGLYYSPGSVATGGVAFSPLATGTTDVSADIPGFLALPQANQTVTVNP